MGQLIIFEGLDGSGKGTQTKLTAQRLQQQGYDLRQITFPDYDSVDSHFLYRILSDQSHLLFFLENPLHLELGFDILLDLIFHYVKKILETVIRNGARTAEPGEFTKRAFLNGRIDLAQAEAVADVIQSTNEYALKSSVSQLAGSVSRKIRELREKILFEIAFIESALDDPEHISLDGYPERLRETLQPIEMELEASIGTFDNGRLFQQP